VTVVAAADCVDQVAADANFLTICALEMQRDGRDSKAGLNPAVATAMVVVACPHPHAGDKNE